MKAPITPVVDEPTRGHVPDIGFLSLPGIERMRTLVDGQLPPAPMQRLTGVRGVQVGHGFRRVAPVLSPTSA